MYGRANSNGRETTRFYQESFSDRQKPSYRIFSVSMTCRDWHNST